MERIIHTHTQLYSNGNLLCWCDALQAVASSCCLPLATLPAASSTWYIDRGRFWKCSRKYTQANRIQVKRGKRLFWLSKHSNGKWQTANGWTSNGKWENEKLKNGKMTFVYAAHASCNRYPFPQPLPLPFFFVPQNREQSILCSTLLWWLATNRFVSAGIQPSGSWK